MMMKFATSTLATILVVAASNEVANASIRGSVRSRQQQQVDTTRKWSAHPHDDNRRRLNLEHDNECLLLLKDIQFEDHTIEEDNWVCEFPYATAVNDLNSREFIDIDVDREVIDRMNPTSGASILKTRGAYVEESLDSGEMKIHVPDDAEMEVITLPEHHNRHYKQRRLKMEESKRRLADSSPGTLNVLVLRVVDADGAKIAATDSQLVDDIFTDEFSLKTGYAQCSHDQLVIEPAAGNGIATVNVPVRAADGRSVLQQEALAKATEQFGSLSENFDLVMVCQPKSGTWLAYAFINSWVSFYNDDWCQSVSAQMHEVGHNLGLGHSNEGETSYGDQSGMLGYSYKSDDGPKMCFNAVKNFQLGWYERMKESFYPLENPDETVSFTLQGINEYKTNGNTDNKLVTLRIVEYGDEYDTTLGNYGNDYYLGYNHASGPNTGTLEAKNKVALFRKDVGGPDNYGESNRLADLSVGQSYKIENFKGTVFNVIIRVKSFSNDNKDAIIEITTLGDGVPTAAPTASCDGIGRFKLSLNIDTFAYETAWELIDDETGNAIESAPKENHLSRQKYIYPSPEDGDGEYYCLEPKCYTFRITDTYGDGLNLGEGDYTGYLDGGIAFEGDGNFKSEMTHKFCVEDDSSNNNNKPDPIIAAPTPLPTKAPTPPPTKAPTPKPSKSPTPEPTKAPVPAPTNAPTPLPTKAPTPQPTKSPTPEPTKAPVPAPTPQPTTKPPTPSPTNAPVVQQQQSCVDDPNFLWKGRAKKNCEWVGKGSDAMTIKKCKRNNGDGKKVYDYCPHTCAKHNEGHLHCA